MGRLWATVVLTAAATASAADDIVIADFDGADYGAWKVEGTAFGPGPAHGTLPHQMPVHGYLGGGLVNSFYQGDISTGLLTSPSFTIERPYINFLIGGGKHPGRTCIRLRVDGKTVRSATGPNDRPGGSERLAWRSWDARPWMGRQGVIQIVDRDGGGWGHINVDQITESEQPIVPTRAIREIVITKRYLHLPVTTGAPTRHVTLRDAGDPLRVFDIELASGKPDFLAFVDVGAWRGRRLSIDAGKFVGGAKALASIVQSDAIPDRSHIYREKYRPQFHFTSRRGWLNDPNGLIYDRGEWHLFYQHNPYGWKWGNMHWGHAVSGDLMHWTELDDAFHPWSDCTGAAFSGSAVVDWKNTSGFQSGPDPAMIAIFTDTGAGESIAYSNDRGRTWTMFPHNPVVQHSGRDPKVIWYQPTNRWVMAVYDQIDNKRYIAFYSSRNLKAWTLESRIAGFYECPNLFELSVDGDKRHCQWVLHAADGHYVLGAFDGHVFQPAHNGKYQTWYGNYYAGQSYFGAPNGRRVQIGWSRGVMFPGMPFNQQMTVPVELTLRTTASGIRLFAEPVDEIHILYDGTWTRSDVKLGSEPHTFDVPGELLDIAATLALSSSSKIGLRVRGVEIVYDAAKKSITCGATAPLEPIDGRIVIRVLVDRGSVEVFGNHGRVAIEHGVLVDTNQPAIDVFAHGGKAILSKLVVHTLKSTWKTPRQTP